MSTTTMPGTPSRAILRPVVEATSAPDEDTASTPAAGPPSEEPSAGSAGALSEPMIPSSTATPSALPRVRAATRAARESKPPTSSQPMETGTVATPPAAATGSAMAWSMEIPSRPGQSAARTSSRAGASQAAAIASTSAASRGLRAARWSSRTSARATNMPAFQR